MLKQTTRNLVAAALLLPLVTIAAAQHAGASRPPVQHEGPTQQSAPAGQQLTAPVLPPALRTRNGYVSIQVNVDANGNNILHDAANEPSLAVDPSRPSRLAAGWRQFDSISSNFREAGFAYSRDAGRTWIFPGVIENGRFRSDPVLDANLDGVFYYYSLTNGSACQVFISGDGGQTWPTRIDGWGGDKNWMVIDKTTGIGSGNIYLIWQRFFNCCDDLTLSRSVDDGASFQPPVKIPSSPSFGTLAVGPDGDVYAGGIEAIDFQNFDVFVVGRSMNAKDPNQTPTFTTQEVDLGGSMGFSDGPNPSGLTGQAQVGVDWSDGPTRGWVYLLCSVDPPGPDPMDVMIARSRDGGETWDPPVRVNDDDNLNAWQWFGTLGVAPNGRIDVVWNDSRNGTAMNLTETYYAYSLDGGETFSVNEPISPVWDSFVGWPQQSKIGDYYELVSDSVGANLIYANTLNGEQDVYFVRLGDYDCNGNGVGDSEELLAGEATDFNANGVLDECEGLGDLNCDGSTDFGDISPFVLALSDPAGYAQQFPGCDVQNADINGDGEVNFGDINFFVALLSAK